MKKLDVLYQHDNNYAAWGGVSILSLLMNNSDVDDLTIWLIDNAVSAEYKNQYDSLAKEYGATIKYLDANRYIEQAKAASLPLYRGSCATYLKLFAVDDLADEVDRIFYLDSDTLITGDLGELADFDMRGCSCAMCIDAISCFIKGYEGFEPDDPYYCGGTILFDAPSWKAKRCTEKISKYATEVRSQFFAADQDLLNIVLADDIAMLPLEYDFYYVHAAYPDTVFLKKVGKSRYYSEAEIADARSKMKVLHFMRFLGESPWTLRTLHPCRDEFNKYLSLSPWKDIERPVPAKDFVYRCERLLYIFMPSGAFLRLFIWAFKRNYKKANEMMQAGRVEDVGF